MKEFVLTCGEIVLLDDEDYEKLPKTGWYMFRGGNSRTDYVVHDTYGRPHRFLLGIEDPRVVVDHIDRNGLNNQRSNLRIVSNSENKRNQEICENSVLKFNGVSHEKPTQKCKLGRIRSKIATDVYDPKTKRYKLTSKSFSITKYGINEALRLAVKWRIEQMRVYGYLIDERSETIEREVEKEEVDMEKLLNISFKDIFPWLYK